MEDCIFCKIIKGEIPCEKIYEDKQFLSFLDINPVNYGHVLIIPKKHYRWITDVPDSSLGKLFSRCKILMNAIKNSLDSDYVVVSVVGVDVPHFHVHLIPRWHNDGLASFWPTKKYEEGKIKEFAERIKKALN